MSHRWLARASGALVALIGLMLGGWGGEPPEKAEAEATAKQLWDVLLTKCGDSYFYAGSPFDASGNLTILQAQNRQPQATEFKGARFALVPLEMSQAQQLNGIEYIGQMTMVSAAFRTGAGGNWGAWMDGPAGRVFRSGEDVADAALGDFVGDAFDMGGGGLISIKIVKAKGVWEVARGSSIGAMVGGDEFFTAAKIAPYTNKYDCATAAIIPSEVQAAAQKAQAKAAAARQAALEADQKARAEDITPVKNQKKGIGFIVLTPSELALAQDFADLRRWGELSPLGRARYSELLAGLRKITDRFPRLSKATDDQYLAPNTTYKDAVLDPTRPYARAFSFYGSKSLVLVIVTSGPYRDKTVAIEAANYSMKKQMVSGGG